MQRHRWEGYGNNRDEAIQALNALLAYMGRAQVSREQVGGTGKEPVWCYRILNGTIEIPIYFDELNERVRAYVWSPEPAPFQPACVCF